MAKRYRSSITGRYVTKAFAQRNPHTTQAEQVGIVRAAVAHVRAVVGR